ncbi:GFA family protein [Bradyrhizobium sp. LHD-71]|uniref:GFA family protein n=1 Tax=Bradyrhizobium sp. LHD-71 TaxID=3072141 RepID=UPI00280D785A|nr:GFA family protein [Bradyrhizobium sp. LHD-71]MDQ8729989.1 GFA family protein [Bradyrhizobium sp. LHD-71]
MMHEGGCLCGAVRFKAEGEPINVRICHCRLCQKSFAAPFFARAQFAQEAITLRGPTARYPTSERIERVFCSQCGTRIGSWRVNGTAAGLALALFDDRNAFSPTDHIWVSEKLDWVRITDELPQFPEGIP